MLGLKLIHISKLAPSWSPGAARQPTRELMSTTHTYPWLIPWIYIMWTWESMRVLPITPWYTQCLRSSSRSAGLLNWVWRRLRLYWCDGNVRFTYGLRARNRILVEMFCVSILFCHQIRSWFHTWTDSLAVVQCDILLPDLIFNIHLKPEIYCTKFEV